MTPTVNGESGGRIVGIPIGENAVLSRHSPRLTITQTLA